MLATPLISAGDSGWFPLYRVTIATQPGRGESNPTDPTTGTGQTGQAILAPFLSSALQRFSLCHLHA